MNKEQQSHVFISKSELAFKGLEFSLQSTINDDDFKKLNGSLKRCFFNNYDRILSEIVDEKK